MRCYFVKRDKDGKKKETNEVEEAAKAVEKISVA